MVGGAVVLRRITARALRYRPEGRLLAVSSAEGVGAALAGKAASDAYTQTVVRAEGCPDARPRRWHLARRLVLSMRAARSVLERRSRDPFSSEEPLASALIALRAGQTAERSLREGPPARYRVAAIPYMLEPAGARDSWGQR